MRKFKSWVMDQQENQELQADYEFILRTVAVGLHGALKLLEDENTCGAWEQIEITYGMVCDKIEELES